MPRQTDLHLDDLIKFYEHYYEDLGVPKCFIANEIAAEAVAGDEKAYNYLRKFLSDEDPGIRYVGIAALRETGRSEGIQILREYLTKETNPNLRKSAAQAVQTLSRVN